MTISSTWTITDIALATIDRELATPAPERGGVLLGPPNARLVTEFMLDPVDGAAVEYYHSDQLRALLARRLASDSTVTYRGSTHSHPAHMAVPSGPDHKAFGSALRQNHLLGDMLFPIVVGRSPERLSAPYVGEHLIKLPHGTFAPFCAALNGKEVAVRRARVVVLPVGEQSQRIADNLGWAVAGTTASPGPDGTPWLHVNLIAADRTPVADVLLPNGYPLASPLLRAWGETRLTGMAWDPAGDPADQIVRELKHRQKDAVSMSGPARPATVGQSTLSSTQLRQELQVRTAYHLPFRGDWHVAVLGAGSVGSVMAEFLVRSGVPRLTLVDPDIVEPANLSRTVYTTADIGKHKVAALADRLRAISPDVLTTTVATDISGWLTSAAPTDIDLVVLATDDILAELEVNNVMYPSGVPLVSVKMFAKGAAGEVLIAHPASGGPCLRCLTGSRAAPVGRSVDYGSGRLVAELALGPDIAAVATKAAKIVLSLLALTTGAGPLTDWIKPLLMQRRAMMLTTNTAGWEIFGKLGAQSVGLDGPYQSLWIPLSERDPYCPICGKPTSVPEANGGAALAYSAGVPADSDQWPTTPEATPREEAAVTRA